ncbi:YHYH domain-containing protein [Gimesia sp.]|uniref:YHYH domain-containing protein n=1 Tax=Gimesia sp. TaxID=2024833 RepID=UPI003A917BAD
MKNYVSWILICVIVPVNFSFAHSGRTDSKGGHMNRRTGDYHYHNGGSSPSSLSLVRTQPRTTFPSTARTLPRSISAPVKKMEIVQPDPEKLAKEKLDRALSLLRETVSNYGETKSGNKAKKLLEIDHQASQEQEAQEQIEEEKKAQEALGLVKWLMEKKMTSSAEKRIQELINDHPNTRAANEAKEILGTLKK